MFVPFCLSISTSYVESTADEDTLVGIYRSTTTKVGIIIDRCRLSHYVRLGIEQHNSDTYLVERARDFQRIEEWVDVCVEWLRDRIKAG